MCHYYIWCFLLTHWHTFWNFDAGTFLLLWKCSVGCFLYNEKSESESHSVMSTSLQNHGLYSPWNSPGQNTGMVAIPFSKGFSQPRDQTQISHIIGGSLPAEPQGKPKNNGVGSLSLLQEIFPTQESNRGLLHGRRILYQLSYQGSPDSFWQLLGHCDSSFALQLFINWNIKELALLIDTMKNKQLISLIWEKCKPCHLNNSDCKMLLIGRFILIKKC